MCFSIIYYCFGVKEIHSQQHGKQAKLVAMNADNTKALLNAVFTKIPTLLFCRNWKKYLKIYTESQKTKDYQRDKNFVKEQNKGDHIS